MGILLASLTKLLCATVLVEYVERSVMLWYFAEYFFILRIYLLDLPKMN